jgi:hypothetical protein
MRYKFPKCIRFPHIAATAVAGVLLGLVLLGGLEMGFTPARVLANPQEAPAQQQANHTCDISNIAVLSNRIHVRCKAGAGSIFYFAMPTTSSNVDRVLSLLLTAETANKLLSINYDPQANGTSFGCLSSDCRPINWIAVLD